MNYSGKKVLVMGLGLHGGGLESARFLLKKGAEVTVTDLRDEKTLRPSIEQLDKACRDLRTEGMGREQVRYVLGRHEIEDFKNADIVIKNPGVRPDSPFLQAAKQIETDLSLFLAELASESSARLFAVTGTKGKSSTASALHWILDKTRNKEGASFFQNSVSFGKNVKDAVFSHKSMGAVSSDIQLATEVLKQPQVFLGGNITVSPLTFVDRLTKNDDVVLELSSFQLGDLKGMKNANGESLLKPKAAVLTAIMADHLDRYASMEEYIGDKKSIYKGQDSGDITVAGDDIWGKEFLSETKARPLVYSRSPLAETQSGGWIESDGTAFGRLVDWESENFRSFNGKIEALVPSVLKTQGAHQKANLLAAALAAYSLGVKAEKIYEALADFPGVEHRLELFHEAEGVRFYNDSAATIPEAAAACIDALSPQGKLILVTGGADKNLDFSPLVEAAPKAASIILLAGSGSDKLTAMLDEAGISYSGPFDDLDKAVRAALENAVNDKGAIIALSPGCASFGMFLNEFDRGRKWKEAVLRLA